MSLWKLSSLITVLGIIVSVNATPFVFCPGKCGIMDSTGSWVLEPKFDSLIMSKKHPFLLFDENGKYGFIDPTGKIVIPAQFDSANTFSPNGFAQVEINGTWGIIDTHGQMVIPPQNHDFPSIYDFNLSTMAMRNGKYTFYDKKGYQVIPIGEDYSHRFASNGLSRIEVDRKYGFINTKGEAVIPTQFDYAYDFAANGLAAVELNKKWGFINTKGVMVIPAQFDHATEFTPNGLARVSVGKWYGFINKNGELVIPAKFEKGYSSHISDGYTRIYRDGKYGLIDPKGTLLTLPVFDTISEFQNNGLAIAVLKGKYGFINRKGRFVIPAQYEKVSEFASNGLATAQLNGKWGFINTKGEMVIPARFDEAYGFGGRIALVKLHGKWGSINARGKTLIPPIYDDIHTLILKDLNMLKQGDKWKFINQQGKTIIPPGFNKILPFDPDGFTKIPDNFRFGFIDTDNKSLAYIQDIDIIGDNLSNEHMEHLHYQWNLLNQQTGELIATYRIKGDCGIAHQVKNGSGKTIWPKNHEQLCKDKNPKDDQAHACDGLEKNQKIQLIEYMSFLHGLVEYKGEISGINQNSQEAKIAWRGSGYFTVPGYTHFKTLPCTDLKLLMK